MRQSVLESAGVILFREVPDPIAAKNQVVLRVQSIGICGSDIHAYHGKHPFISLPVVQGHEATGIVEKIGEGVSNLAIGDRVALRPQRVCGKCHQCLQGEYNICEHIDVLGCLSTGAASDYFAVDADLLYKLPDEVDFDTGTLFEPLSVAVHAIRRGGGVAGKKVLVLGAGTIGNLVAQAAKGMGAASVMITDVSDYRLGLAKSCGIDFGVNVQTEDLEQELVAAFGADKADIIFECATVEATITQAISLARKGTAIVIVGVFADTPRVNLALVQDRELSLIGTLCYVHDDYEIAIQLVKEKKIELKKLITDTFPFEKFAEAYHYIEERKDKTLKVIVQVNS